MKNLGAAIITISFLLAAGCGQQAAVVKADGATNSGVQTQSVAVKMDNRPYAWFYATRSRVPVWRTAQEAAQAEAFSNPSSPNPFSTSGEGGKESTTNSPSPQVERGAGGEGLKPLDLLMKYDRVNARQASDPALLEFQTTAGATAFASAKDFKPWNPDDFFTNKENLLYITNKTQLYAEVERKTPVETVEKETVKILKESGGSQYITAKSGKTGWMAKMEGLDLNWNSLSWKEEKTIPLDRPFAPKGAQLAPEDMLSLAQGRSNAWFYFDGNSKTIYTESGNTNISKLIDVDEKSNNSNINNVSYTRQRRIFQNFYGFFGVIDIWVPDFSEKQLGEHTAYYVKRELNIYYEDYKKYVDNFQPQEEIVDIQLFTRDNSVNLITNLSIHGVFAFNESMNHLQYSNNQTTIDDYGNLVVKINILQNGRLTDPLPAYQEGDRYPVDPIDWDNGSKDKYIMKPVQYLFRIQKTPQADFHELVKDWKNYQNMNNNMKLIRDMAVYEKLGQAIGNIVISNKVYVNGFGKYTWCIFNDDSYTGNNLFFLQVGIFSEDETTTKNTRLFILSKEFHVLKIIDFGLSFHILFVDNNMICIRFGSRIEAIGGFYAEN